MMQKAQIFKPREPRKLPFPASHHSDEFVRWLTAGPCAVPCCEATDIEVARIGPRWENTFPLCGKHGRRLKKFGADGFARYVGFHLADVARDYTARWVATHGDHDHDEHEVR